jgi:hypothetical protein
MELPRWHTETGHSEAGADPHRYGAVASDAFNLAPIIATERRATVISTPLRTASPHVGLSVLLSHEHGSFTLDDVASTERQHCGQ